MKDNFSTQASQYAKFRPSYPSELYELLLSHVNNTNLAWDCATGNGQIAVELAKTFNQVIATDISAQQLANATKQERIIYKVEPAENTSFADQSVDLITIGQAIHWFNFELFFAEVKRVLKPDGLFAAIGYGLMKIDPAVDQVIMYLYEDILGKYWDEERRHIENNYKSISFPFTEIVAPTMAIQTTWNFQQLLGYLETWSSLQHYIKANQSNPLYDVTEELKKAWGNDEEKEIRFPLIVRVGRVR